MKRFTIENLTKDKLHALFEYLKRSFAPRELEPFKLEELDRTPLEDSSHIFFRVEDKEKGLIYELEVSDFSVYMQNYNLFNLKFELSELCLVLDYHNESYFDLYLISKKEDEDCFKPYIFIFTPSSMIYTKKNINMKRMKAWFEFTADKIETYESEI